MPTIAELIARREQRIQHSLMYENIGSYNSADQARQDVVNLDHMIAQQQLIDANPQAQDQFTINVVNNTPQQVGDNPAMYYITAPPASEPPWIPIRMGRIGSPIAPTGPHQPQTKCQTCHRKQYRCKNCGDRCGECCTCTYTCKECRKDIKWNHLCQKCYGCRRHCKCVMQEPRKSGVINTLARPLGVELEMINVTEMTQAWREKFPRSSAPGYWEHDGTIHPDGMELVMNPASGDKFIRQMYAAISGIIQDNAKVNESCGFHVHVQAGDLSAWELRRLVYLWCRLEPDIYRYLVAPHRLTTSSCLQYSMPLSTTVVGERSKWQFSPASAIGLMRNRYDTANKIKVALIKRLYELDLGLPQKRRKSNKVYQQAIAAYKNAAKQFDQWKQNKRTPGQAQGGGCRYASLNLHSWFYRGTVEFRLKEGTIDPEELIMWPLFCGWLIESLSKLSDIQVQGISHLEAWCEKVEGVVQPGVVEWVRGKIR